DRGNAGAALDGAERFLRRVGENDRFQRIVGLELAVRASIAVGDLDTADEAAGELRAAAGMLGTPPLRASALLADGRVAAARGDAALARPLIDDAADAFDRSGAPYEAAQARLELAAVLRSLGEEQAGRVIEEKAWRVLRDLGLTGPPSEQEAPGS